MELLKQILLEILTVYNESAIYILFGFFIAGILHLSISPEKIVKYLGQNDKRSVILSALFGMPLPLCSCSVLPVAVSMKRQGASRGATVAFLISTPETGVDSISLTYALMDPLMTVSRPVAAVLTALTAGFIANFIDHKQERQDIESLEEPLVSLSATETASPDLPQERHTHSTLEAGTHSHEHTASPRGYKQFFHELFHYAYVDLLDDIAVWLVIGVVLAGIISALVPNAFFENYLGNGLLSMLVMLVVGIPLYICAASSTPVAAALVLKGLNPGAALVFLLAGPATNIGALVLVAQFLGKKMLVLYLGTIIVMSLLLGMFLNLLYAGLNIDPVASIGSASDIIPFPLKLTGAIILAFLLFKSLAKLDLDQVLKEQSAKLSEFTGRKIEWKAGFLHQLMDLGKQGFKMMPVLIPLLYLLTGFYTIQPGERGMIQRFGVVTERNVLPGLHYKWPWPFESVAQIGASEIRRIEVGYSTDTDKIQRKTLFQSRVAKPSLSETARGNSELYQENEGITGDENIVNIHFTVQYLVKDPFGYLFKVSQPEILIKALAKLSMHQVLVKTPVETVLTTGRSMIENKVKTILQSSLDHYETGIEVLSIAIIYDHAPESVHSSFRDVASSEEDKNTRINLAYGYQNTTLAQARGNASKLIEEAHAYQEEKYNQASGEAGSFLKKVEAYQPHEKITELRLYLETVETTLPKVKKFIQTSEKHHGTMDLWFLKKGTSLPIVPEAQPPLEKSTNP